MKKEPSPLLVTLGDRSSPRLAHRLMARLLERGFRVEVLDPEEAHSHKSDIILIPCRLQKAKEMARFLEGIWTSRWLSWYTATEKPKGLK